MMHYCNFYWKRTQWRKRNSRQKFLFVNVLMNFNKHYNATDFPPWRITITLIYAVNLFTYQKHYRLWTSYIFVLQFYPKWVTFRKHFNSTLPPSNKNNLMPNNASKLILVSVTVLHCPIFSTPISKYFNYCLSVLDRIRKKYTYE